MQDEDAYLKRQFIDSGRVWELTKIALASCWPLNPQPMQDEIHRQFVGFCAACEGARLAQAGRASFHHWQTDEGIDALLEEVGANLPHAMRESELSHPAIMGYDAFAEQSEP